MRAGLAGMLAIGCFAAACAESPSSTVDAVSTPTPAPSAAPATARVEPSRRWDPRDVDRLPAAPDDVAPLVPAVIEPPVSARPLAEAPVRAAVLTVTHRRTVFVLAVDGTWRSIPVPERYAQASLAPAGTRLLFTKDSEVDVWDLTTGERATVPFPDRLVPWDFTRSKWLDETTLLLDDYRGGWLIDVTERSARRVPYPTRFHWAVDSAGTVVERVGRLERLVVTTDRVIGTTYTDGRFRVVVADRSTMAPRAVLPLRDFEGNYSNWALGPVAAQQDGTVIIWVAVVGKDDGWRLVAWDPRTDDLSLVSRSDAEPTDVVTYAVDLLR